MVRPAYSGDRPSEFSMAFSSCKELSRGLVKIRRNVKYCVVSMGDKNMVVLLEKYFLKGYILKVMTAKN